MSTMAVIFGILCMLVCHTLGSYSLRLSNGTNLFSYQNMEKESFQLASSVDQPFDGEDITQEEEITPTAIEGLYLQELSPGIASQLRQVCDKELGISVIQTIYDNLHFSHNPNSDEKNVRSITDNLEAKFSEYLSLLNRTRSTIEESIAETGMFVPSAAYPCFQHSRRDDYYDVRMSKSLRAINYIGPLSELNLTSVFVRNAKAMPTLKLQYLMAGTGFSSSSDENLLQDMPCNTFDETRLRSVFLATTSPDTNRVIIMIDYGRSLSTTQLELAKVLARNIIETLSHHDHIGVIGLAEDVLLPMSAGCSKFSMPLATHETKYHLLRYIDNLTKSKEATNHSIGFKNVFEIIRRSVPADTREPVLVIYLSRGILSSLAEAKVVMQTIAKECELSAHNIIINTCALIDDEKPIMYEEGFLQDVADLDFAKYNISVKNVSTFTSGISVAVNTASYLGPIVGQLLSGLPPSGRTMASSFFLPDFDSVNREMVLSIAQPCKISGRIVGVLGIDLHLSEIVENVTYFNTYGNSYAFLINKEGYTLMHPSLSRPTFAYEQPMVTDIKYLENKPGFESVRGMILKDGNGTFTLEVKHSGTPSANLSPTLVKYTWRHLKMVPYIVVVVSTRLKGSAAPSYLLSVPLKRDLPLVYHRGEYFSGTGPKTHKLCRHLRLPATFDIGSLFLSASCFQSPSKFLESQNSQTILSIQSYMAYLHDTMRVLSNPGLKPSIRDDVTALSGIVKHWQRQHVESDLRNYIIRRYISTPSGVVVMYPGSPIEDSFDPTRRPWFTRAMEFPGRVVITAPYLDVGGAGFIVTLSHTVYEARPSSMHSAQDSIVAVAGVDFTIGYLYKLLVDSIPFCEEKSIKCFIMDDKGYLISHPSLTETTGRQPLEQQHVTHKESLLAHDILSHKGFVTKRVCNNFSDRTMQRFYQFNTSMTGVLTNLVHGEHCVQYQVTVIPGTNVFLGVVNQTCDIVTAFCPCSMVDRNCLNCARMEQTECECPCECPLGINYCTGDLRASEASNPSCSNFPEILRPPVYLTPFVSSLPSCHSVDCESVSSHRDCRGIVGCEWCQIDSDGQTPLNSPFCTQQLKCFNGLKGAATPYGESPLTLDSEESTSHPTVSMGPVAAATLLFFLGLAFMLMLYCYRQHGLHSQGSGLGHAYLSSGPDTGVRMSQLDNEPDDMDILDDSIKGQSNQVLQIDGITPISPYRVNTGYKRPAGGDSDHGYSTMTPHDDSETLASSEPLILGACSPPKRSASRTSRGLMPDSNRESPSSGIPPQTVLPSEHHVLASVTVHMVDI